MKARTKKERTEIWWTMVHAIDLIKFTFQDNFEGEDLERAKDAYYTLIELSNKYQC